MIPPTTAAMLQGIQQGDQQAASILPSVSQAQGRAQPSNPWRGSLDLIRDQVLQVAAALSNQGDNVAQEEKVKLFKIVYEIERINKALDKQAQEGGTSTNGQ